jgi:hypothetical protein
VKTTGRLMHQIPEVSLEFDELEETKRAKKDIHDISHIKLKINV